MADVRFGFSRMLILHEQTQTLHEMIFKGEPMASPPQNLAKWPGSGRGIDVDKEFDTAGRSRWL
jgi:hypothetical protein